MSQPSAPSWHRASTSTVLELAWRAAPFRADDLISELGMTRSTALAAVDALIEMGLVAERERDGVSRAGRPARVFQLAADAGVVVGLDAGGRHFMAVATDLAGGVLASEGLDLPDSDVLDEQTLVSRRVAACEVVDAVLAACGRERRHVLAVGVGIPSPVDAQGRSPQHAHGFWRAMNAGLGEHLRELFPVVVVDNDASLAAWAEATVGAAVGSEDFVALLAGRRLGSGVFLGGRPVRGCHGGVGELEGLALVPEVGGAWGLGWLAEQWIDELVAAGELPDDHPAAQARAQGLASTELLARIRPEDPLVQDVLERLGSVLGVVCVMIARFYDPEKVVLCGSVARSLHDVMGMAAHHLAKELELPAPELVISTLGSDVVSRGAAMAARDALRGQVLELFAQRRQGESG